MINLTYKENKVREEEYYKLIIKNRDGILCDKLDSLCMKYMNKSFHDVILLAPEALKKEIKVFDSRDIEEQKKIQKEFHSVGFGKKQEDGTRKPTDYIVKNLYGKMKKRPVY